MLEGLTFVDVPVTVPMPWLMLRVGEPVTDQVSVLDVPVAILAGVVSKLVMDGALPTVTVAVAVTVPKELVAARV